MAQHSGGARPRSRRDPGVIFISLPKRKYGDVEDAWTQFMWIVNTAKPEKVALLADFRNGYDRAISWIFHQARKTVDLEMVLMLDGDVGPEMSLHDAVELARQAFEDPDVGAVMSPVPSQSLRVMVQPKDPSKQSKTSPYEVTHGAITNFGFIRSEAFFSLEPIGMWGDVESTEWPAYIEERMANGTGDTHLCTRLGAAGWKILADPRLLCHHSKVAKIQSDRPRTQIGFEVGPKAPQKMA